MSAALNRTKGSTAVPSKVVRSQDKQAVNNKEKLFNHLVEDLERKGEGFYDSELYEKESSKQKRSVGKQASKYSRVPNKRIDTFIFSNQIRLFWQV